VTLIFHENQWIDALFSNHRFVTSFRPSKPANIPVLEANVGSPANSVGEWE
jgi:hypothetical protein